MATCVDRTCPKTLSARLGPFGYKMIQTSKERSFAQKVVQLAIDHTFWYHSKAQECVGFNALFDPTYENP